MAFRSFSILPVLLSAVLAQLQSNPLITDPSGISPQCIDFLNSLNSNAGFTSCTNPYTTALGSFTPGANTTTTSSTTISNALSTLCASNAFNACPQNTVTAQLSAFYAACSAELTSTPVQDVKLLYDFLYSLVPLRQAICSKDDGGKYCATELSNSSSTGTVALVDPAKSQKQSLLSQYLYTTPGINGAPTRRDATSALVPNATTYQNTNLLFLFLEPSMNSSELCTTCTRGIMTAYITFMSSSPYGPGMNNSLLFSNLLAIFDAINSKCGSNFLNGAVQAAGGLSSGLLSGAAPRAGSQELAAVISAILGVAAVVAASL